MTSRFLCMLFLTQCLTGCDAMPSRSPAKALAMPDAAPPVAAAPLAPADIQPAAHRVSTLPRLDANDSYGVWLADDESCWLRLEKPRFRIIVLNREIRTGWLMTGYYAEARDGGIFGYLHEAGRIPESARQGLAWNNETSLRGLPMTEVLQPFGCEFAADGGALKVVDFRGPTFHDERDGWHGQRLRKVALTRPGHAGALPPVGNWGRRPPETRDRVLLSLLPERIKLEVVDGKAGTRTRWSGECAAGAGGLVVFGQFTHIDRAFGREQPSPLTPPSLFALRLIRAGNHLVAREVISPDLDTGTQRRLLGDYRAE